ncbi:MAG: FtsX-like permease family protein [Chloroflexi bacterium]|nr:FtsX-like permease family protein [Chloroflexota bacterium]
MDAIWGKIKADITSRPIVSILITITIIAASALLTLALATLMNIGAPYDRSFQELNGAHLWLYFDRDRIRSRDIAHIETLPIITGSTGLQYSIKSRVQIDDTRIWTSLRVIPADIPTDLSTVNRLLVQDGRYLTVGQTEILASKDLKDLYHLAVSDTINITGQDGKKTNLLVIGLAYNPMWDTYRNSQPPYLYVSKETLRDLFPDESTWDWSIGLRLNDPESVDDVLTQIEAILRADAIASHTDWRDVKESAVFGAQLNFVFLGTFSFFAILAAALVIASSIGSLVLSQFRQIGILKAIGFTQNQILTLYIGQYMILGLIGCPLGLLLGIVLSPLPLKSVAASLSTSFQPPVDLSLITLVLGIVASIITAATLGAARRGAKANIIKAIAIGAEAPHKKPFWGVRLATHLGFSMTFILGLNDISVRPFRSFMTGLNLTLGVVGVIFGLTLNETLKTYEKNPALLGIVYDAIVTREESSDNRTQGKLRRAPGVDAFYSEYLADVETQQGQSFQMRAVKGDLAAFPFIISEGRFFQPNTYEAIAGQGLLDWLGLAVGDELTLILDDKTERPVTWKIVGRYPEPVNAGQMLMVSWPTVARLIRHAQPQTYFLKLAPDTNTTQLKQYLEPRAESDLNIIFVGQTLPDAVFYLQLAIFALSGILIAIALINVFNTSLLAVQEKLGMIGVLKTLGMTPAQVVAMVNTTAGLLGLLATATGVPLGLVLTQGLLTLLSRAYGFGEVNADLNYLYVLLLIPLMIIISIVGSIIPGQRAARVSIVQVLRNE